jgi:hypothetical protein
MMESAANCGKRLTSEAPPHASELSELIAASVTTVVRDGNGRAVGQHATVLPGSLLERDVLAQLDARRREDW